MPLMGANRQLAKADPGFGRAPNPQQQYPQGFNDAGMYDQYAHVMQQRQQNRGLDPRAIAADPQGYQQWQQGWKQQQSNPQWQQQQQMQEQQLQQQMRQMMMRQQQMQGWGRPQQGMQQPMYPGNMGGWGMPQLQNPYNDPNNPNTITRDSQGRPMGSTQMGYSPSPGYARY